MSASHRGDPREERSSERVGDEPPYLQRGGERTRSISTVRASASFGRGASQRHREMLGFRLERGRNTKLVVVS